MLANKHLITYCDDLPAMQAWLGANYEDNKDLIFRTYSKLDRGAVTDHYVFVRFDRFDRIKSEDESKSITLIVARNQRQIDLIDASPLEVLARGDIRNKVNCPYKQIMNDPAKLAKLRLVVSEKRQTEEFGGDFRFCYA